MDTKLKNNIESLLFISHKPLSIKELTKIVGSDQQKVEEVLESLDQEYSQKSGGIRVLHVDDKYQLATSEDSSNIVKKFIKSEMTSELTKPSLESLTIIAYRGPISKAELELIRGVNCSVILRNLLMRGLIEAKENKERMIMMYNVTFDLLKYLGISRQSELPDYEKLNKNNNLEKLLEGTEEMVGSASEINNINSIKT